MFWPAMLLFAILAIAPFIAATVLNRVNGDSLSDEDAADIATENEA